MDTSAFHLWFRTSMPLSFIYGSVHPYLCLCFIFQFRKICPFMKLRQLLRQHSPGKATARRYLFWQRDQPSRYLMFHTEPFHRHSFRGGAEGNHRIFFLLSQFLPPNKWYFSLFCQLPHRLYCCVYFIFRIEVGKRNPHRTLSLGPQRQMHQRCTVCTCPDADPIIFPQPVTDRGGIVITYVKRNDGNSFFCSQIPVQLYIWDSHKPV